MCCRYKTKKVLQEKGLNPGLVNPLPGARRVPVPVLLREGKPATETSTSSTAVLPPSTVQPPPPPPPLPGSAHRRSPQTDPYSPGVRPSLHRTPAILLPLSRSTLSIPNPFFECRNPSPMKHAKIFPRSHPLERYRQQLGPSPGCVVQGLVTPLEMAVEGSPLSADRAAGDGPVSCAVLGGPGRATVEMGFDRRRN